MVRNKVSYTPLCFIYIVLFTQQVKDQNIRLSFRLFLHYSNITDTLLDKDYIKFNFIQIKCIKELTELERQAVSAFQQFVW